MEHLEIKSGPFHVIRAGIAILNIIAGVASFIASWGDGHVIVKISAVFMVFFGIYLLTYGFGFERCWLGRDENSLTIKWINRMSPLQIHDTRIFKISLERARIMIYRKEDKPIRLSIDFLEKAQKTEVYKFFIEYAGQKGLTLEKHSSMLL
jgi:hypothetical protein